MTKPATRLKRAIQMVLPSEPMTPDRLLLRQFADEGDQEAFAALVRRHAAMVLGVCRRVLPAVDAEDACQATFVILARKAKTGRWQESVANWLFTTARRVAHDARRSADRRLKRERGAAVPEAVESIDQVSGRELLAAVDEELNRLPPIYREPLVLFYLEHSAREEIAARLGVPAGTVKIRLERGRKKLGDALTQRGFGLGAGLLVLAATSRAGASPPRLCEAILAAVSGNPPAAVAALVEGVAMMGVIKKAMLTAGVIAGVVALALGTGSAARTSASAGSDQPKAAAKPAADHRKDVTVSGRVLGPDGKPFAGAKLYLATTYSPKGRDYPVRATSGADGRFDFTFARSELDKTWSDTPIGQVLATAEGFGFDVAVEPGKDGELTLRLVEDVPVSGRVLDQDGKAVAGAKVRVADVRVYKGERLDEELEDVRKGGTGILPAKGWTGPLPGQPASVTTGPDGRFRLTGIGRERLVALVVEGPGIQYARLQVMTRAGKPVVNPSPWRQQRIHGAAFEYLAAPSRPIRGVVRDEATGKPVAGVRIESTGTTHTTRTDKDGRFELLGYPKSKEYHLTAVPAEGQPYFVANAIFPDAPGFAPLDADVQMVRGIVVRGRITDKDTGKPIPRARVEYCALYPNPNTRDGVGDSHATTGPDGSFEVVALPGQGLLAVAAYSPDYRYMPALVTTKEMKEFFKSWADPAAAGGGLRHTDTFLVVAAGARAARLLGQESYNAIALIEPDAKSQGLNRDVALQPGLTRKGSLTGPDGQPVAGVTAFGLEPHHAFASSTLETADFTVKGINPRRLRQLLFVHEEKGLGFYQEVRGDEKGPLTVKLQPLGSASGRAVDKNGQPIAGLVLNVNRSALLGPGGVQVKTDKDGRFRAKGLVPGQKYDLSEANRMSSGGMRGIVVEPGKDKDLGDVNTDPDR